MGEHCHGRIGSTITVTSAKEHILDLVEQQPDDSTYDEILRKLGKKKLPHLRLSGQWLHDAGFGLGREFEITVAEGRLVIEAV